MLITDKKQLSEYGSDKRLWQGIPSVEVTKGGRTFVAFYSGGIAEQIGNYVVLIMSEKGGDFGEPIAVCSASTPRASSSPSRTSVVSLSGIGSVLNVASVTTPSVPCEPQVSFTRS